jgi:hypothetical protein
VACVDSTALYIFTELNVTGFDTHHKQTCVNDHTDGVLSSGCCNSLACFTRAY